MKYTFIVRHISYGGVENAAYILAKELHERGFEVEILNLGESNRQDVDKWSTFSTVKSVHKWQLLFYKHGQNKCLILTNLAGYKYIPNKNKAVFIHHGDITDKLKKAKSRLSTLSAKRRVRTRLSKGIHIFISKELARRAQAFTTKVSHTIPNPYDEKLVQEKSNASVEVELPESYIVHIGRLSPE